MAQPALNFLYERAEALGVLDGESALIVAPTATGKSHIAREAICRALAGGAIGTRAYPVPFRALATRASARGARKEPPIQGVRQARVRCIDDAAFRNRWSERGKLGLCRSRPHPDAEPGGQTGIHRRSVGSVSG